MHRDLAARNVLLNEQNTAKVSDFGSARKLDESGKFIAKNRVFAIRWAAFEVHEELKFSVKSDVWSFSMIMFEILSNGKKPFADIPRQLVHEKIKEEIRPQRPVRASVETYDLMKKCWQRAPSLRPSFEQVLQRLEVSLYSIVLELSQCFMAFFFRNSFKIIRLTFNSLNI